MSRPDYIYYLALIFIGLPAVRVPIAAICVAAGAFCCLLYTLGAPMVVVHLIAHLGAIVAAIHFDAETKRARAILALFVSMFGIDLFEAAGAFTAFDAWWARWWLVLLQLALLIPDAWAGYRRGFSPLAHVQPRDWLRREQAA